MKELWADVEGYDGYQVSDQGRVRSHKSGRPKLLVGGDNGNGYRFVGLSGSNGVHNRYVHRLVAFAFIGEPPSESHTVNHIDYDIRNNKSDNLEWMLSEENQSNKSAPTSSKHVGVIWNKRKQKWAATISDGGFKYSLGLYDSEIEAFESRLMAEEALENGTFNQFDYIKKPSSVYPGVSWNEAGQNWKATLHMNGKNQHLGYFYSEKHAAGAYMLALKQKENQK